MLQQLLDHIEDLTELVAIPFLAHKLGLPPIQAQILLALANDEPLTGIVGNRKTLSVHIYRLKGHGFAIASRPYRLTDKTPVTEALRPNVSNLAKLNQLLIRERLAVQPMEAETLLNLFRAKGDFVAVPHPIYIFNLRKAMQPDTISVSYGHSAYALTPSGIDQVQELLQCA